MSFAVEPQTVLSDMKRILPALAAAVLFTGCTNTPAIIKAMAASNASLSVDVRTVYGTVRVVRLNPSTNTLPHTVGKDGELTVTAPAR